MMVRSTPPTQDGVWGTSASGVSYGGLVMLDREESKYRRGCRQEEACSPLGGSPTMIWEALTSEKPWPARRD